CLPGTAAKHRAGDGESVEQQRAEVDLGSGALLHPDDRQVPPGCQGGDVALQVGRADDIENDIDPTVARGVANDLHEVLFAVVDPVGAEFAATIGAFTAARGSEDHGAGGA